MTRMWTLNDFYSSKEWRRFRDVVIAERLREDGMTYDEITGKPILRPYDIILHHVIELTEENVNDRMISLNPANIQIVSHKTHNAIHNKLGYSRRQVYLVYGAPCAGKTTYVDTVKQEGDLIIDLDAIWQAVSGCEPYVKPNKLKSVVFRLRDDLLGVVRYRFGKWDNAYIVGGYPLMSERERLVKEMGAREIFVEADEAECLRRAEADERKDAQKYAEYIKRWFDYYGASDGE